MSVTSRTPVWLEASEAIESVARASSISWRDAHYSICDQMGWIRSVLREQGITSETPLTELKVLELEPVEGYPPQPDDESTPQNYPYLGVGSTWGFHYFKIGWRLA